MRRLLRCAAISMAPLVTACVVEYRFAATDDAVDATTLDSAPGTRAEVAASEGSLDVGPASDVTSPVDSRGADTATATDSLLDAPMDTQVVDADTADSRVADAADAMADTAPDSTASDSAMIEADREASASDSPPGFDTAVWDTVFAGGG